MAGDGCNTFRVKALSAIMTFMSTFSCQTNDAGNQHLFCMFNVQCDFNELTIYVAVPSGFIEKYDQSIDGILYVVKHPE